jgi:DNA-binding NarL/FixJ family response regulator
MVSRTRDGRPLWLEISTLSGHAGRSRQLLVVHLFRAVLPAPGASAARDETACARGAGDTAGPLTAREVEVLRLLRDGSSTPSIAVHLDVSQATVRNHMQSILAKLGVHSRLEAVAQATRRGILF